ncbi:glutamine amidotransferase, partial [Escherichia coli]
MILVVWRFRGPVYDVLPVTMLDGDDRVEKPEGVIAQPS